MIRHFALAIVGAAAFGVTLVPGAVAASPAPPTSCVQYASSIGKVLGFGAMLLRQSEQYIPLIQQAAYAGIDDDAGAISAVAKKTSAIDAKLGALVATAKTATARTVTDGRACATAGSSCVALIDAGTQMLGILSVAAGDAAGYRNLIAAAAKAGHDENASALKAVVATEERLTTQITQEDGRLTAVESRLRPLEQACHG
jgi:ferritin-like metal-binding protein YciE